MDEPGMPVGSRVDDVWAEGGLSDEELTALALAADPQSPIDDDAVPIGVYLSFLPGPLPEWYMPVARGRGGKRWRIPVVTTVVVAFLVIDAFGLCNTFGFLSLA
jgi:hypothetical protein